MGRRKRRGEVLRSAALPELWADLAEAERVNRRLGQSIQAVLDLLGGGPGQPEGPEEVEVVASFTVSYEALGTVSAKGEVFWEALRHLLRSTEQHERAAAATRSAVASLLRLLPESEELVRWMPARSPLRRWQVRKPSVEHLRARRFQDLAASYRRYLVLLGLQPDAAGEEAERARRLVLELYGFTPRDCPKGHFWWASPTSRAKVACPVHSSAVRSWRHRTGQATPRRKAHRARRRSR